MAMPIAAPESPAALSPAEEDALVRQHLPLVGYAVSDLSRRLPAHVQRDDLMSAGMAALAMAARSFQEERGVPFGRYASRRIQGALLDELRNHDWASRSVRRRAREQDEAAGQLAARLGREATPAELAETMGVRVDEIAANQHDVHRSVVLSFQAVVEDHGVDSVLPSREPSPDQVLLERERQAYLRDAVELLPERLRAVVVGVFFEERPMQQIADEFGVTESRISQMRSEALALLKDGLTANLSPEALPQEERPDGRVARRKAAYYTAIATQSDYRTRLSVPVPAAPLVGAAHSA
ncbi:MAG: sigma-70 family RNA polymerase sigma factor [Mycobacteriales bacterium]